MNEKHFTYDHFDNCSYMFLVLGFGYLGLTFMQVLRAPVLIAILLVWTTFFAYCMFRMFTFLRQYKNLNSKQQGRIIRRHMYSRKWGLLLIPSCLAITWFIHQFMDLNYLQIIATFAALFFACAFIGIRIFLRSLKPHLKQYLC